MFLFVKKNEMMLWFTVHEKHFEKDTFFTFWCKLVHYVLHFPVGKLSTKVSLTKTQCWDNKQFWEG
jgi:hypothetical protein